MLNRVRGYIEDAQTASRNGNEEAFARSINSAVSALSGANAADPSALLQALGSDSAVPAVQAVYARLRRSMDPLGGFEAAVRLPTYQPMDRASAVIHYADRVPFAWVVAIAIDVLPLSLLLLVLLAAHRAPPPPAPPMIYDYDYEELLRATLEDDDEIVDSLNDDPPPAAPPRKRGRPRKT